MAVITIPPSAFATSKPTPTTALDRLQQNAKAMRGLQGAIENLSLAMTAETGSAEARKALAKARAGLLSGAATLELEPDFAQVLDEAALLQARGQATVERQSAIGSLVATIKQTSALPLPFAQKAALGRALVGRAVREGLLGPAQQRTWEEATASSTLYQETRRQLAATSAPGEALALVTEAKAAGGLVEHDSAALDELAAARQPIETHRHQARLAWKEADDFAAYARGELPEPLGEDSFRLLHGARGAVGAYARYQATRQEAEVLALIRGKDNETIAAAQANWQGDSADFERALAKDAAERRRDPAGYALATVPGLAQAMEETPEAERGPLLWSMQESLGFAEGERSPWTAAQERALADAWDELPAGHGGRSERLAFFENHLLSLPPAQREGAIARLVQQGIVDGTEAELTRLVADLDAGRVNPARAQAAALTLTADARSSQPDALLQEGDGPEVTARGDQEVAEPLGSVRERVAVVEAVGRIQHADNLFTLIPRIRLAFADDPQAAATLEAKARELAANPPPLPSRDTEGRVRDFSQWAGDLGFYRDSHLLAAGEAVQGAGYDIAAVDEKGLAVSRPGETESFAALAAEQIANLNLSEPKERARFRLLLDTLSQALPLEELVAAAEAIDPTITERHLNPRRGVYETTRPSETAKLVRLAEEALANGADPDAVAAALVVGLFPVSDWQIAGELLFSLTPFGFVLDAADAGRAMQVLQSSDDDAEREAAYGDLVIAMVGFLPAGDLAKAGTRAMGAASTALRRLADVRGLSQDELVARATRHGENALRNKKLSVQIERMAGESWKRLSPDQRRAAKGAAAYQYGKLAEEVVRPAAAAKLQREGFLALGGETELVYEGVKFRIDVVGVRQGAELTTLTGANTIQVGSERYLLADIRLIDAKFASARLTDGQNRAAKRLRRRGTVEIYSPKFEDVPIDDLLDRLNGIDIFREHGVVFTEVMVREFAGSLEKGTTLASVMAGLLTLGFAQLPPKYAPNGTEQDGSSERG